MMENLTYDILRNSLISFLRNKNLANFDALLKAQEEDLALRKLSISGKLEWNLFRVTLELTSKNEIHRDRPVSPTDYCLPA